MKCDVRQASIEDVPVVLSLLRELADFEGKLDRVEVTEAQLAEHAFGPRACIEMLLGSVDGRVVSYAIFFPHFGSYRGRAWLFLEDLYVQPAARGTGVGRAMMSELARIVMERSWAGMTWGVLEWNDAAFRFYEGLGAVREHGHVYMELSGEALQRVAAR
ncbi:MAG: GNAT family N-acetyltransferase [Candidatus Solibacter sp.]